MTMTRLPENTPEDVGQYMILTRNSSAFQKVADAFKFNFEGEEGLSVADLDSIHSPAGNVDIFPDVPGPQGTESQKTFTGIIFARGYNRAYHKDAYRPGSNTPPDCSSLDGVTGIGIPGGDCATCPFNQFGSARNANTEDGQNSQGKACREYRHMFTVLPHSLMPFIVQIPPGSIRSGFRSYMKDLAKEGYKYHEVETLFRIETRNSAPVIIMERYRNLNEEQQAIVNNYASLMRPLIAQPRQDKREEGVAVARPPTPELNSPARDAMLTAPPAAAAPGYASSAAAAPAAAAAVPVYDDPTPPWEQEEDDDPFAEPPSAAGAMPDFPDSAPAAPAPAAAPAAPAPAPAPAGGPGMFDAPAGPGPDPRFS